MIIFLIAAIAFFIYWSISTHNRLLNEKRKQFVKYLGEIMHTVSVERYDDIEYWFDADTHKFLGQGSTLEEMISVIKSRFPDHVFLFTNVGGLCAKTDWKLTTFEQLKQIDFTSKEGK